jgi:hypothetical protein
MPRVTNPLPDSLPLLESILAQWDSGGPELLEMPKFDHRSPFILPLQGTGRPELTGWTNRELIGLGTRRQEGLEKLELFFEM